MTDGLPRAWIVRRCGESVSNEVILEDLRERLGVTALERVLPQQSCAT